MVAYNSHSQSHSSVYSGVANLFSNMVGAEQLANNIVAIVFCGGTITVTESCGMLCGRMKCASVKTGTMMVAGQTTYCLPSPTVLHYTVL